MNNSLIMICGIHGKVVIEDFKISKSGKKICKLCTTEKNKRSLIKASLKRQTLETITLKEKKCSKCKEIKLIENFHKSKSSIDGNHTYCKSCQKLYKKEYYSRPGVKIKSSKSFKKTFIKRIYDLSMEEYKSMKDKQNNLCKICKQPEKSTDRRSKMLKELAIDHCHKTGKIRGLLCKNCNQGLGQFKDNIDLLLSAAKYLYEN